MAIPVNTLMEEAKCYTCLGISVEAALELALLNRIASGSGGGVPSGVILMWSGSIATIPSGWVLCNGSNGTPDLRDRFVPGAGSTYAVGATGGAATHFHTINPPLQVVAPVAGDGRVFSDEGGVTGDASSLPPYYALAYIMKT